MIEIKNTKSSFEREPLAASFGFKGSYVKELWQSVAAIEDNNGLQGVGLGVQSILWSDANVFSEWGDMAGNNIMFLMTQYALKQAKKIPFDTPMDLLEQLLPLTMEYGRTVTGNSKISTTFALNALVSLDNAAWILYCRNKGISSFDDMIPKEIRPSLSFKHEQLASIPLISYGINTENIKDLINQGYFFLKIKIGNDPEKDNDPEKMLEWDKKRLASIHEIVKDYRITFTENGYIPYYLDANGRYPDKDHLMRFLDYADKIGALERIMLLEEPFPESYTTFVDDIPVRLAADESAHSDKEALERIHMGYGAIALKPIAKTMSMSLKISKIAYENKTPCFCADLTVNPILVDWNKNVAARLAPLPGMKIGVLESNGRQNYLNWDLLKTYHPCFGGVWLDDHNGIFKTDGSFYELSGGVFMDSAHYLSLI